MIDSRARVLCVEYAGGIFSIPVFSGTPPYHFWGVLCVLGENNIPNYVKLDLIRSNLA